MVDVDVGGGGECWVGGEGRRGGGMEKDEVSDVGACTGADMGEESCVRSKLSISADVVFRRRGDERRGSARTRGFDEGEESCVKSKLSISAELVFCRRGDVRRGSAITLDLEVVLGLDAQLGADGDARCEFERKLELVDWVALEDMDCRGGRGREVAAVVRRGWVGWVAGGDLCGEESVRSSVSVSLRET